MKPSTLSDNIYDSEEDYLEASIFVIKEYIKETLGTEFKVYIPEAIAAETDTDVEEYIADYISDKTGYLVDSFDWKWEDRKDESLDEDFNYDLADEIAEVLDNYGIMYGDIVANEDGSVNIVGVDEDEWYEAQDCISRELGYNVLVPDEDHEEFDDELVVTLNESLKESKDKVEEAKEKAYKLLKKNPKLFAVIYAYNQGKEKIALNPVLGKYNQEGLDDFIKSFSKGKEGTKVNVDVLYQSKINQYDKIFNKGDSK